MGGYESIHGRSAWGDQQPTGIFELFEGDHYSRSIDTSADSGEARQKLSFTPAYLEQIRKDNPALADELAAHMIPDVEIKY